MFSNLLTLYLIYFMVDIIIMGMVCGITRMTCLYSMKLVKWRQVAINLFTNYNQQLTILLYFSGLQLSSMHASFLCVCVYFLVLSLH